MVYPQKLDWCDLESKDHLLIFPDGAFRRGSPDRGESFLAPSRSRRRFPSSTGLGSADYSTAEKTLPQIKKFLDAGGSVIDVGSSTGMAELSGVPVSDYLTQMGSDGKPHPLPREKYFIPGLLVKLHVNPTDLLATECHRP